MKNITVDCNFPGCVFRILSILYICILAMEGYQEADCTNYNNYLWNNAFKMPIIIHKMWLHTY